MEEDMGSACKNGPEAEAVVAVVNSTCKLDDNPPLLTREFAWGQ